MSDHRHLSALELDELLAQPNPPEPQCADCRAKFESLRSARTAARAHPKFAATLDRLAAGTGSAAERGNVLRFRRRGVMAAAGLALAASVVFLLASPDPDPNPRPDDGVRLKGEVHLEVLDETGMPVTHAKVGQKVVITVSAGAFDDVQVDLLDDSGKRESLIAKQPAPRGFRAPLRKVEVTEGAFTLEATFSSQNARDEVVRRRIEVVP